MKKIIRQDNTITNARYDFTACQMDILFCAMSQINDEDTPSKIYTIHARQIEQMTGRAWHLQQFKDATENMGSRMFEIKTDTDYTQFWLFQKVRYVYGQGKIEIRFSQDAMALLKQLKSNFTTYELQSALSMSSKYAKRIYQLCSQWKDVGETKKYEIVDFKYNLGLIDKSGKEQFKQITHLREKVLDIAMKQINKNSDLEVSYLLEGENGKLRPLKHITFYIKKKASNVLAIEFDKLVNVDIRIQNLITILDNFGISSPQIRETIINNENFVKEAFSFNYQLHTGKIKADKNAGGLLLKKLGLV